MTGAIEPYCYPKLRDGLFQRTLFIAPNTAAILSSSVQQNTDGMLNLFLTDRAAINALVTEYEHFFTLCRPLMRVYTGRETEQLLRDFDGLAAEEGNACLSCVMPPLFAMPEQLAYALAEQTGNKALLPLWKHSLEMFRQNIETKRLSLTLFDPKVALLRSDILYPFVTENNAICGVPYTKEQYLLHVDKLRRMEQQYDNLQINFRDDMPDNTMLYVKEDTGVIVAKLEVPQTAFLIRDRNMVNAFWDYVEKGMFGRTGF